MAVRCMRACAYCIALSTDMAGGDMIISNMTRALTIWFAMFQAPQTGHILQNNSSTNECKMDVTGNVKWMYWNCISHEGRSTKLPEMGCEGGVVGLGFGGRV